MTTWYPDTCSCVLIINPDGETGSAIKVCPLHADPDPAAAFKKTLAHNRNKNSAMTAASQANVSAVWGINPDGSLSITLASNNPNLQNLLQAKFGAKVAVSAAIVAAATTPSS